MTSMRPELSKGLSPQASQPSSECLVSMATATSPLFHPSVSGAPAGPGVSDPAECRGRDSRCWSHRRKHPEWLSSPGLPGSAELLKASFSYTCLAVLSLGQNQLASPVRADEFGRLKSGISRILRQGSSVSGPWILVCKCEARTDAKCPCVT